MGQIYRGITPHYRDKKYYFFGDKHYGRYTAEEGFDQNYPRYISEEWSDLWDRFPGPYDAVLLKSDKTAYYFFKGDEYARYQIGTGIYKPDYPYKIADHWDGMWNQMPGPYDAVYYRNTKNKYYFFKGGQYSRYTPGQGLDSGYPKNINDEWHDLWSKFPGPYDAAVASVSNHAVTYFFKGDQYVRYEHGAGVDDSVSNGKWNYPQSTDYRWSGAWMLKKASALTIGEFTKSGPTFSIRTLEPLELFTRPVQGFNLRLLSTINNTNFPGVTSHYCVEGMAPGQSELISLFSGREEILSFNIKNAPSSSDSTAFSFAMGSCFDDAINDLDRIPTIESMISDQPEFMMWNGDTSYYIGDDRKDQRRMFLRMFETRHQPSIVKAMEKIPAVSSWDDHDFGSDDSNKEDMSNAKIKLSTEVFKTCWPNNYANLTNYDSIEHSFRYGQTEFFCPDTRTFREPNRDKILGDSQTNSLIVAMERSNAALKVVMLSSQLIPQKSSGEGFYDDAPDERQTLLNAFTGNSISGRVLILSGDVHYSELSYYGGSSTNPKVVEVTSSPTLLKNTSFSSPSSSSVGQRIWGVKGNTYALFSISYFQSLPQVDIRIKNESGNTASIHSNAGGSGSNWGTAGARWTNVGSLIEL